MVVGFSSSSSSAAAAMVAVAAAISARARSSREEVSDDNEVELHTRGMLLLGSGDIRQRQWTQLHSACSFGLQGSQQRQQQDEETPPSPSILSQSVGSEVTTSRSTTIRMVMLAQAMSQAPGADASQGTDFFLSFATSTVFTASARGSDSVSIVLCLACTYLVRVHC
jgi:hypothetical protein